MLKKKLTSRKKQAIATRKRIHKTALNIFKKRGYENVTIDEICDKAGVSIGTFYRYFQSKDMVIRGFYTAGFEAFEEHVEKELNEHKSVIERMFLLGSMVMEYISDMGSDQYQIVFRTQLNINNSNLGVEYNKGAYYGTLKRLIEEGQANGEIRTDLPCDDIAKILYNCGRGMIYDWSVMSKGQFDLVKVSQKMYKLMIESLRPG